MHGGVYVDGLDFTVGISELSEWLRSFGIWAVVVSLLLNISISVLGIIPTLFLSGVNAAVFGIVPGFLISLVGEALGAGVSYWLYRWGYAKITNHDDRWRWQQQWSGASRSKKLTALLLGRITPLVPSGIVTFAAAAARMRFDDFLVGTLIGKIPSIALETLIGHDLLFLNQHLPRLLISLVLVGVILLLFKQR